MRKLLFPLAVLSASFLSVSAEQALVLKMSDGSGKYIRLTDFPKIRITDNTFSVSTPANDLEFPRREVKSYSVADHDFSSVRTAGADCTLESRGLEIAISGLRENSAARLIDMAGRTVCLAKASSGKAVLTAPAPGAYLVETETSTFKTVLRK